MRSVYRVPAQKEILTVTGLTERIKLLLESGFGQLWVEGEVSNLRRPASGHLYFSLKDSQSQIRAVMFRLTASCSGFEIQDGMQIVCRARLSVYSPRGEYQIILDAAEPKGIGALQVAFEQLKAKLGAEGLFEPAFKKPIPFLPVRIGVITSPSGAVIRDILNVTRRRFPSVHILVCPVRVQGPEAPLEIVEALKTLHSQGDVDVIIIARGGGSLEDLASFNDERVARAIFSASIPVISAIGHEIDFTIADFVSDLRAPTPSAAAELVVPEKRELIEALEGLRMRLINAERNIIREKLGRVYHLSERLQDPRKKLADIRIALDDRGRRISVALSKLLEFKRMEFINLRKGLMRLSPQHLIKDGRLETVRLKTQMVACQRRNLDYARQKIQSSASILDSLSPLSILGRGYAIVLSHPGRSVISDASQVSAGDNVNIKLGRGHLRAKVLKAERAQ